MYWVVYLGDCMADWELGLTAAYPDTQESIVLHITSQGKDKHSKLEVQLLLNAHRFRTIIKSKISNLYHCKLETYCIVR